MGGGRSSTGGDLHTTLVRGQRAVLERIAEGKPLQHVLEGLCAIVEDSWPGTLCSILLLTEDGQHLRHGAAPSLPAEYCAAVDGIAIGPALGSCGTAAYRRAPVVVTDIATDPLWRGYEVFSASFGLAACASTPIFEGPEERLVGTFAIYHRTAGPYAPDELELLDALSNLAAIAIRDQRREGALRESEARLARTTAVSPVIETHVALDGRWLRVDPRVCALLGRTEAELLAARLQDVIHPDDLEADHGRYEALIREEIAACELETRLVRKDGTSVWTELRCSAVRDAQGKPTHLIAYVSDLSARKHTEEMLRASQKMESLGMIAAGACHDFNNLLMAILCQVSMAQLDASRDSPVFRSLADIELTARRAGDLTRQLLAYAAKGRVGKRAIDLNSLAHEIGQVLSSSFTLIEIEFDLARELPPIAGAATQLHQAVMNLVINAAQAIGDQPGRITIRTRPSELAERDLTGRFEGQQVAPGEHVLLEVSDTGRGMSADVLRRVFDPFFTTKPTGRGLGLAVLRGILREHRAGLAVTSEEGRGTTFQLYFPVARVHVLRPSVHPAEVYWPAVQGTVLVVDDEPIVRKAVVQMVKTLGFDAIEAVDGQDALYALAKHDGEVALVILDLAMPRMGGREALAVIRERWPALRVIVTTAGTGADDLASRGGEVTVLAKPYNLLELKRALIGSPEDAEAGDADVLATQSA